ncbi:Flagellar hook-length control protein FliK [Anaerohalosphaera lusitana]|uniref:Flagellar hook-length control protein FliK n=1 Tax=Anaerohalosphaera lusitana TaxID=1936003 RepID=A0A1U9NH14_9BACT|nr:flagellar hook-length control protein FliK [Anaerohalosphaera lusitana]AQT66890.1 Flagellar hook-length control protein FliK [Anaerohalosphaera lusitana]
MSAAGVNNLNNSIPIPQSAPKNDPAAMRDTNRTQDSWADSSGRTSGSSREDFNSVYNKQLEESQSAQESQQGRESSESAEPDKTEKGESEGSGKGENSAEDQQKAAIAVHFYAQQFAKTGSTEADKTKQNGVKVEQNGTKVGQNGTKISGQNMSQNNQAAQITTDGTQKSGTFSERGSAVEQGQLAGTFAERGATVEDSNSPNIVPGQQGGKPATTGPEKAMEKAALQAQEALANAANNATKGKGGEGGQDAAANKGVGGLVDGEKAGNGQGKQKANGLAVEAGGSEKGGKVNKVTVTNDPPAAEMQRENIANRTGRSSSFKMKNETGTLNQNETQGQAQSQAKAGAEFSVRSSVSRQASNDPIRTATDFQNVSAQAQSAVQTNGASQAQGAAQMSASQLFSANAAPATQTAQAMAIAVQNGQDSVSLMLNPPELGRVNIQFAQENGEITGFIQAEKLATRDEIAHNMTEIVRSLQQSGLAVKKVEVVVTEQSTQDSTNADTSQDFASQQGQTDAEGRSDTSADGSASVGENSPERAKNGQQFDNESGQEASFGDDKLNLYI